MTREEATEILRKRQRYCKVIADHANATVKADELREIEAIDIALSALRPISREKVERVQRGEWVEEPYSTKSERNRIIHSKKCICSVCNKSNGRKKENFCPACGAPMTDEAVQMVMERMEALHEAD